MPGLRSGWTRLCPAIRVIGDIWFHELLKDVHMSTFYKWGLFLCECVVGLPFPLMGPIWLSGLAFWDGDMIKISNENKATTTPTCDLRLHFLQCPSCYKSLQPAYESTTLNTLSKANIFNKLKLNFEILHPFKVNILEAFSLGTGAGWWAESCSALQSMASLCQKRQI